jgi:hypothetical protein
MAELRLIVLCALVACSASEAGPSSGLTLPPEWKPLPELATAATGAAKRASGTVDGAEGWGEPGRGCYGAWLGLHAGTGSPAALATAMLASVPPELAISDVVKPPANGDAGVLTLSFTRAPYSGRVRAQLARSGAVALVACFWNAREPVACQAQCAQLLGSMK